ncbi:MAG: sulfate adenylyltransferase, partial [Chloroflexi bacterium]|nr:sulfate adenylyltransferase [Chloroflexota bacterium]
MADLIPPHGGLTEPVDRSVPADEVQEFKAKAAGLAQVPVSDADLSSVYRLGDGTLSPLTGPMDSTAYYRVLEEGFVENNGAKFAWTIPIAFPVTADQAAALNPGESAALTNSAGAIVATVDITDVYPWDKQRYIKGVYQTERTDHPGADMVLKGSDAEKSHLIGGSIRVLPQPVHPRLGKYVLSPRQVRRLLEQKGWDRVVAFQTRNPLHRAHEYALVYGL